MIAFPYDGTLTDSTMVDGLKINTSNTDSTLKRPESPKMNREAKRKLMKKLKMFKRKK